MRIIFGLNEETGSRCVKHYIEKGEEMPTAGFTPDAEYPIINGEKGIVNYKYRRKLNQQGEIILKAIKGGIAPNVVPEYAEAEVIISKNRIAEVKKLAQGVEEIKLEEKEDCILVKSFGISAHGSRPEEGKNAVSNLLLFLGKLDFTGSVKEFLDFMNENIGLDTEGRKLGIYLQDEMSGKFVFNLGMLVGNEKEVDISINMRYPVTKKYEDFKDIFENRMREGKMEELSTRHKKSLYVSTDSQFIKKLQKDLHMLHFLCFLQVCLYLQKRKQSRNFLIVFQLLYYCIFQQCYFQPLGCGKKMMK